MPDIETIQALLAEVDALLHQSRKTQTDLRDQQDKLLREPVGLQLTLERLGGTEKVRSGRSTRRRRTSNIRAKR